MEVSCRMHGYALKPDGDRPTSDRPVFTGTADQIASDIRRYEEMGVSYLVAAFLPIAIVAKSRDELLHDMEELANRVWPRV